MNYGQVAALFLAFACIAVLYTRMGPNDSGSRDSEKDVTRNQEVLHAYISPELVSSFDAKQRARLAGLFAGMADTLAADASAYAPAITMDYQAEQLFVRASAATLGDLDVPDDRLSPLVSALKPLLTERLGGDSDLSADERRSLVDFLRAVGAQFGGG